jgi:hypothetical protein
VGTSRRAQGTGQKRVARHLASPSLGHYASLSFIVRGRGPENCGLRIEKQGVRIQNPEFRCKEIEANILLFISRLLTPLDKKACLWIKRLVKSEFQT